MSRTSSAVCLMSGSMASSSALVCSATAKLLADSAEISTKALDLRGMLDALRLIRRGVAAGAALDMGITNKAFDSYEQGLIRDVIAARIPAQLTAEKLFG